MTANQTDELAEIITDFLNAMEAACVNARRKIAEIKGVAEKKSPAAVNETIFSILKFEAQQGAKLGEYAVAYKANNPTDSWNKAFEILTKEKATIQERYHGKGYVFSYWLYGSDKIYKQKIKTQGS